MPTIPPTVWFVFWLFPEIFVSPNKKNENHYIYYSIKTYVVGTQANRLEGSLE